MLLKQPSKSANIYAQLKARRGAVQEPCFLGQYFSTSLTFLGGISFLCGRVSAGHITAFCVSSHLAQ